MADLTITATNVVKGTGATFDKTWYAGTTITAGQPVYVKTVGASSTLFPCKGAGLVGEAAMLGIALNGGAVGQSIIVQTGGQITIGATTVLGKVYVVSAASIGGIAPISDLASTNFETIIGYADTVSTITFAPILTGTALP